MDQIEQYKAIMSEIIRKQIIILGPSVAVMRARRVSSLVVGDDGTVANITGDPSDALGKLIDSYVDLSGQIVKNTLGSIFTKYPNIKQGS